MNSSVLRSIIIAFTFSTCLQAKDEWLDFRGPNHNGIVENRLPTTWSEGENVTWKTEIHDHGISTPVILNNKVVLTSATEDGSKSYFLIVDFKSGKILHDELIFTNEDVEPLGGFGINTYATPSVVSDGKYAYIHFGTYGTACIDPENAKVIWKRQDINCLHYRGPASSPILYNDLLILTMDGIDQQFVTALDKHTGKTVWLTPRSTDFDDLVNGEPKAGGDMRKGFNTPLVITVNGKDQLISVGAKSCFGYEPSTGKEIWLVTFPSHSAAARPFYDGEKVYISTGYGKADLFAIRPDGHGDVTDSKVEWVYKKNVPKRSSFLVIENRLYMVDDGGVATCLNSEDGEMIWRENLGGNHSASLLFSHGHIYAFNEFGDCRQFEASDTFKIVKENKLDVGMFASPAVVGDSLMLRTSTHLYRIDG
jgi:outer membrane protein assembly factor BamB